MGSIMGQKKKPSIVLMSQARGVYSVGEMVWVVGLRYRLHEHVGAGAYGDVCRATDLETLQTVALKRIRLVFQSPVRARRILREVCIMRRLRHPSIINLSNVFTSENLEIPGGTDLYIATDFADGGDLYSLNKKLRQDQVQLLMWQLLSGISYLHSCHVWHRDIKPENVLLSSTMDVKICDFNLSRSTMESSTQAESKQVPITERCSSSKGPVLTRQYTKTVVTPGYRAPEVTMSQGQYTSAIDIWAVGCIFWELLYRQVGTSHTGPPTPLFAVRSEPSTPREGEEYVEYGNSKLSEQVDVIFRVIGTPCWKDIESIPSKGWRSFLKQVPGRAGNLLESLTGVVEKEALDLLSRMLAFDPAQRCTAEEALKHAYFKRLKHPRDPLPISFKAASTVLRDDHCRLINDPAMNLGIVESVLETSMDEPDGGKRTLEYFLQWEIERQRQQLKFCKNVMADLRSNEAMQTVAKAPTHQFFLATSNSTRLANSSQSTRDGSSINPIDKVDELNDWQYI